MRNYKYLCLAVILIISCFVLSSCGKQEDKQETQSYPYSQTEPNEDTSQLLANDQLSNSEKTDILADMTDSLFRKAEKYRTLIKQEFRKTVEEANDFYNDVGFSLSDAEKSVDDYCEYLKNEYESNKAFFENCATVKYQQGTAGSTYQALRDYECAKSYADKLEHLYNDLIGEKK